MAIGTSRAMRKHLEDQLDLCCKSHWHHWKFQVAIDFSCTTVQYLLVHVFCFIIQWFLFVICLGASVLHFLMLYIFLLVVFNSKNSIHKVYIYSDYWGHIMIRDSTLAMICLMSRGRFLYQMCPYIYIYMLIHCLKQPWNWWYFKWRFVRFLEDTSIQRMCRVIQSQIRVWLVNKMKSTTDLFPWPGGIWGQISTWVALPTSKPNEARCSGMPHGRDPRVSWKNSWTSISRWEDYCMSSCGMGKGG